MDIWEHKKLEFFTEEFKFDPNTDNLEIGDTFKTYCTDSNRIWKWIVDDKDEDSFVFDIFDITNNEVAYSKISLGNSFVYGILNKTMKSAYEVIEFKGKRCSDKGNSKLGFFNESLDLDDWEEEFEEEDKIKDIIKNNNNEQAARLLFNRDIDYLYNLFCYIMLVNEYRGYRNLQYIDKAQAWKTNISPAFKEFMEKSSGAERNKVCQELQDLNIRGFKWSILHGRGGDEPLSLLRSVKDYAEDYYNWWKTISDQILYMEQKGWGRPPRQLGFFNNEDTN